MRLAMPGAVVVFLLLCTVSSIAQITQLPLAEVEKRNAAAAFATTREASLFLLVGECSHLMVNSNVNMNTIARGWFDRNKPEMEATYTWLDRYFSHLKVTNPEGFKQASTALARATGNGVLQASRLFFSRKPPDITHCEKAAITYSTPQLDLKISATNPGFEQFAEFPATLARVRTEPNFAVPPNLKFGMEKAAQSIASVGSVASLDAAEAAKERGDGAGRAAIFKGLAERGDGHAATQVGLMYLNGEQVQRDAVHAYRWFYAAWSLSDMDGLNAMGVMNRDGIELPVNLPLAGAAFYLTTAAARNRETFDRASNNLDKLGSRIDSDTRSQIACMRLSVLDDALRAPIRELVPVVQGKSISNSGRRLGEIVKELSGTYKTATCN
nr:hypothetical protein [uncultured Albidiferax sp.]